MRQSRQWAVAGLAFVLALAAGADLAMGQRRIVRSGLPVGVPDDGSGTTAAPSGDEGIHIAAARETSFSWIQTDTKGGRWDIYNDGRVNSGTNSAYSGGLQLQVNNSPFQNSNTAKLNKDGTEIEIGPWRVQNLNVYRRVYINSKSGYCRWIDIFENNTDSNVRVSLRYYTSLGDSCQQFATTSGGAAPTEKDWGVTTYGSDGSSRPAVVHILGSPQSKTRLKFTGNLNDNSTYMDMPLDVPAHKAAAVCVFEAQRQGFTAGSDFMKAFKPQDEIRDLPAALRRIIVNIADPGIMLGNVEIRRNETADLVILRNGDEMPGTVTNEKYVVKTSFGELTLKASDVIGLAGLSTESTRMHVVLSGGQVLAGDVSGEIVLKLQGGTELKLPTSGVKQVGYKVCTEKPEGMTVTEPLMVFRAGERLAFSPDGVKLDFVTPFGAITLSPADLKVINLDMPGGALHQVVFRNGSVLPGLLGGKKFPLKLKLGPTIQVGPETVSQVIFPNPPAEGPKPAVIALRNGDSLFGQVTDKKWVVKNDFGNNVEVACEDMSSAEFSTEAFGQVKFTTRNGATIGGRLTGDYINFQIEPGPAVKLFIGHVSAFTGAPKQTTTTSAPTTGPAAPPAPVASGTPAERLNAYKEKLDQLQAQLAESQKQRAELMTVNDGRERLKVVEATIAGLQAQMKDLQAKMDETKKQMAEEAAKAKAEALRSAAPTVQPNPPAQPVTMKDMLGGWGV